MSIFRVIGPSSALNEERRNAPGDGQAQIDLGTFDDENDKDSNGDRGGEVGAAGFGAGAEAEG
eukprot:3913557-Pleurochrysis_carterae.AAC.1